MLQGLMLLRNEVGWGAQCAPNPSQPQNPAALPSATSKDGTSSSLDLHALLPLNPRDPERGGGTKAGSPVTPHCSDHKSRKAATSGCRLAPQCTGRQQPPPGSASHWGPPRQPHIRPHSHPTVPGGHSTEEGLCSALPWTAFPAFHGGDPSWPAAPALPPRPSQRTHFQHSFQAFTPSATMIYALRPSSPF